LNGLPKVKKFIKEEGHADFYPGFKVNFIPGKPPELVCFKGDEEVERIDLSDKETQAIHELVVSKGYARQLPLSLAAKRDKGEELTDEDWDGYINAREARKKARADWEANKSLRLLVAWEQAPTEPAVGDVGTWLVQKKPDQLPDTSGAQFRLSMALTDKAGGSKEMAKWGIELDGALAGDGSWVKFATENGDRFLPVVVQEVRMLRPLFGVKKRSDEL